MTTCRTPDDAFDAGYADAAGDPPLTPDAAARCAAILAPHVQAPGAAA